MERTPVVSSNVRALGYDAETQTLEVEFHPRRDGFVPIWQYQPVAPIVWAAMNEPGESIGRWLSIVRHDPAIEARRVDEIGGAP